MRRDLSLPALSIALSLPACSAPSAPSSVETGLDGVRSLASLDDAEIERACDGWIAYATAAVASADGPMAVNCVVSAALDSSTPAECETAYAACIASAPDLDTFCATETRTVPECDASVTVARYESCMTANIDAMAALDLDCSLAGQDDEIRARLAAWTVGPDCEPLRMRECAPFAAAAP